MNLAKYTKIRKKKTPWWLRTIQILLLFIVGSVVVFIFLEVYKHKLFGAILHILTVDTKFLILLLVNVFLVCAVLMVILYQWMDRENIRFKAMRNRYRSLLVSADYYHSLRRMNIDELVTGSMAASDGRLEIDHGLKDSSLVMIDDNYIHKNAWQTQLHYTDGKLDGIFLTYFNNGNLLAEISYKNGKLDGRSVVYYPNGFLHNEKFFIEGKLNGVFRAWDEDGALFFEIEYADDAQHGFDKTYRKNGIIEYEDTYIHGVLMKRKTYDEAGQFKYVQKYHDDVNDDL